MTNLLEDHNEYLKTQLEQIHKIIEHKFDSLPSSPDIIEYIKQENAYLKEKLRQKDILISQLNLKFEKYETDILDKNLLLKQETRKYTDYRYRESISSLSTIYTNNSDYDKLLNEKNSIEDKLVELKLKYANTKSEMTFLDERNKILERKNKEFEMSVENQSQALALKEELIKAIINERSGNDVCFTDPGVLESFGKKKIKKQNSLGNIFKGLFKK